MASDEQVRRVMALPGFTPLRAHMSTQFGIVHSDGFMVPHLCDKYDKIHIQFQTEMDISMVLYLDPGNDEKLSNALMSPCVIPSELFRGDDE